MHTFKDEIIKDDLKLKLLYPCPKMSKTIFETIEKSRDCLTPWFDWALEDETKGEENIYEFLKKSYKEQNQGLKFDYFIFYKNEYVGNIGVMNINLIKNQAEIGYWISKHYQGLGIMSQSLKLIENECFNEIKLKKIEIICDVDNVASINFAIKNGYLEKEKLKKYKFSKTKDKMIDVVILNKIK